MEKRKGIKVLDTSEVNSHKLSWTINSACVNFIVSVLET